MQAVNGWWKRPVAGSPLPEIPRQRDFLAGTLGLWGPDHFHFVIYYTKGRVPQPGIALLGTVTGIIKSFNAIQAGGMGDPRALSGGSDDEFCGGSNLNQLQDEFVRNQNELNALIRGSIDEIVSDPRVAEIYLGTPHAA